MPETYFINCGCCDSVSPACCPCTDNKTGTISGTIVSPDGTTQVGGFTGTITWVCNRSGFYGSSGSATITGFTGVTSPAIQWTMSCNAESGLWDVVFVMNSSYSGGPVSIASFTITCNDDAAPSGSIDAQLGGYANPVGSEPDSSVCPCWHLVASW